MKQFLDISRNTELGGELGLQITTLGTQTVLDGDSQPVSLQGEKDHC